jgi:hypothetical protein
MRISTSTRRGKKRNTVVIEGDFRGRPPVMIGLVMIFLPGLFLFAMINDAIETIAAGGPVPFGNLVPLGICSVFVAFGVGMTRASLRMRRMVTISEAADRLGMSRAQFLQRVNTVGIEPDYEVNGEPMFLPDTVDELSLLRPASGTSDHEHTLLRAAGSGDLGDDLLRATGADTFETVADNGVADSLVDVFSQMTDNNATIDVTSDFSDSSSFDSSFDSGCDSGGDS